jgi:hypothetical protein
MGATPDQLKREIDQTREELRADVEVLAEHLDPKRAARRGVDRAREKLREPKVQAVLVTGAGLVLLRRRRSARRRAAAA